MNHRKRMTQMTTVLLCCAAGLMAATALGEPATKIDPNAIAPITQKDWPRVYATWGTDWVSRINKLMPIAAAHVAKTPECDKVEIVGFSEERSQPRKSIVLWVDCANMKRFFVSDRDLQSGQVVSSQQARAGRVDPQAAVQACEVAVKRKLSVPLSFDRKVMTTLTRVAPATGNLVVEFQFEAKNGLGGVLPQQARCVIDDRGLREAAISAR